MNYFSIIASEQADRSCMHRFTVNSLVIINTQK